jgi:hypothetical protein
MKLEHVKETLEEVYFHRLGSRRGLSLSSVCLHPGCETGSSVCVKSVS